MRIINTIVDTILVVGALSALAFAWHAGLHPTGFALQLEQRSALFSNGQGPGLRLQGPESGTGSRHINPSEN